MKRNPIHYKLKIEGMDTRVSFDFYERFIDDINDHILADQKELDKRFTQLEKELIDSEGPDAFDMLQDEINRQYHFIPSVFYNSVLISMYSFLENKLIKICALLHKHVSGETVPYKPPFHAVLKTCLKQIRKYDDLSTMGNAIDSFRHYNALRNRFVHHDGRLNEEEAEYPHKVLAGTPWKKFIDIDERRMVVRITDAQFLQDFNGLIRTTVYDMVMILNKGL